MGESKYVKKNLGTIYRCQDFRMCTSSSSFLCESGLLKLLYTCPTIHQMHYFMTPRLCWCKITIVQIIHGFLISTKAFWSRTRSVQMPGAGTSTWRLSFGSTALLDRKTTVETVKYNIYGTGQFIAGEVSASQLRAYVLWYRCSGDQRLCV